MTKIKRFSLIIAITLASAFLCSAQEQAKESVTNALTTTDSSTTENAVGPINGEGTTGKIAKFTGTNAIGNSVITENGKKVSVNFNSPTAHLQVHGPPLSQVSGNGTNASTLLQTSGGKGGNTNGAGKTGGKGANISLVAGQGGNAVAGSTNGSGGSITLQPGSLGIGGAGGGGG